jgi:FAD dependent oxidoreductase
MSSSHIAYGSIRIKPVFMIFGHIRAMATVMAIDGKMVVQDVPYAKLRERFLQDVQVLAF